VSRIVKRSVSISGHRTSFSLEDAFLAELRHIAGERGMALAELVAEIDAGRPRDCNLSSALRLHVLADLRRQVR
jgi:predicted DNA-binding ribbon-helix-helix protein